MGRPCKADEGRQVNILTHTKRIKHDSSQMGWSDLAAAVAGLVDEKHHHKLNVHDAALVIKQPNESTLCRGPLPIVARL